MKTKLVAKACAAATIACVGLAGCSNPGVAARVNGRVVTEQSVDELAAHVKDNNLEKAMSSLGVSTSTRIGFLRLRLISTALSPVLDKERGKISASRRSEILRACVKTSAKLPSDVEKLCLAQKLVSQSPTLQGRIQSALAGMKVRYSERYGVAGKQGLELPEYLTLPR